MQAFILTCLLCLQTQIPCDSLSPQDLSCSQCLTDLHDHFNLTNSSDTSEALTENLTGSSESGQGPTPAELKDNLEDLFADMKAIVQSMKGDSDDIYGMINKMKNETNQVLVASGPSALKHDGNLLHVPSQKGSLEKILEKFVQTVDRNDDLQRKLTTMQSVVSNGEGEKRYSLRKGDRLIIGESLFSQNGKYRWNFELETADSVIYDQEEGKEVKRKIHCFSKPIGLNINIFMNQTLELYWNIWHGKSTNEACSYRAPKPCVGLDSNCSVKLDNDGHVKLFTSHEEAVFTFF